jgi:hypothetical protein
VRVFTSWPSEITSAFLSAEVYKDDWVRPYGATTWADLMGRVTGDQPSSSLPGGTANLPGVALLVLLAAGLVSFVLDMKRIRWWRVVVFTAFAALAIWRLRAVPFFAIVAGPIVALNVQDYLAGLSTAPVGAGLAAGGRLATLVVSLALLLAAWFGWLFPRPDDARRHRRVAWRVDADASLVAAAETLNRLHSEGKIAPEEHGFNFSPDVAAYCSWFGPQEQSFADVGVGFAPSVQQRYVELRRQLATDTPQADWSGTFRDLHITHVIVSASDREGPTLYRRLWANSVSWVPVYLDGRTGIFFWRDPQRSIDTPPVRGEHTDLNTLAFGRNPIKAPDVAPPLPQVLEGWQRWTTEPVATPVELDAARHLVDHFEYLARVRQVNFINNLLNAYRAGMIMTVPERGVGGFIDLWVRMLLEDAFLSNSSAHAHPGLDIGEAAALVLAIRNARRAQSAAPDEAAADQLLAQAYTNLWRYVEEPREVRPSRADIARSLPPPPYRWGHRPPPAPLNMLATLREIQIATALQRALISRPDAIAPRLLLARTWLATPTLPRGLTLPGDMHLLPYPYDDLAWDQLTKAEELANAANDADAVEQVKKIKEQYPELATSVGSRRDDYELQAKGRHLVQKVELALHFGLAGQALDLLDHAQPSERPPVLARLYLYLLLAAGRTEEVRVVIATGQRLPLGNDQDWYLGLVAASAGDYALAQETLAKHIDDSLTGAQRQFAGAVGQALLDAALPRPLALRALDHIQREFQVISFRKMGGLPLQLAAVHTVRGVLALESGNTAEAATQFRQALRYLPRRLAFDSSRPMVEHYLNSLEAAATQPPTTRRE